ncbi:craniofacial development protein 2-like [Amphiura filiformis]|uniref:craniofacial development protein 2-like n=1 Tax=Amphiura filiformis TaxID=82378 RepID=UPI003B211ABC
MMSRIYSTRVKAPDINQSRFPQGLESQEHDDASTSKRIGRDEDLPSSGGTPYRSPIRRAAADNPDGKRAFLNAKQSIGIGTWNVRTLHQTGNLELLISELDNYDWEVMGIAETHFTIQGEFKQDGLQFLCSSNEDFHRKGVALVLNKNAQKSLLGYNPISQRIISARLRTQVGAATIIQVYAPNTSNTEEEMDEFYEDLQRTINEAPSQDMLIVMGDFNSKVGKDWEPWNGILGKYGCGERNQRGEKLLNFCATNNLCISNTKFNQSKFSREWTWESPDGTTRNKIDFILIQQKWNSSISNSRSYPSADIGSDHQMVLADLKLKLKVKPKANRLPRYEVTKLKSEEIRESYEVTIGGRFKPLLNIPDTDVGIEDLWSDIRNTINETSDKLLGKKKPQQQKPWISTEVLELSRQRSKVKLQRLEDPTLKHKYNFLNREIKRKSKECKDNWLRELCKDVDDAHEAKKPSRSMPP